MPIYADGNAAPINATLWSVTVTTTNISMVGENPERRSLSIYNEGPSDAKLAYAAAASATSYSVVLPVGGWLELPVTYSNGRPRPYAGGVSAITDSGTATLKITEF